LLEQLYQQSDLSVPDNASRPGEKCHPDRAKDIQTLSEGVTSFSTRNWI